MNILSVAPAALLAFSLLIVSCGGDTTSPQTTEDESTDSTDTTSDSGDVQAGGPFFPLVAHSEWEYEGIEKTLYVVGDTLVENETVSVLRYSDEPKFYVRRSGDSYFGVEPETGADSVILKQGNVGTSWVVDPYDHPVEEDTTFEYEVVRLNDRHSVNGKIYRDILQVRVNHLEDGFLYAWDEEYYARGIGLVERGHYRRDDAEEAFEVTMLGSFFIPGSSVSVQPAHREGGRAYFDGMLWKTSDADYYERGEIDEYINFTMRGGANLTLYQVHVKMARIDVGVYPLDSDSTIATLGRLGGGDYRHSKGEIEILYNTPSEIEGTFWIEFENGNTFTEGTFRIPRQR